MDIEVIQESIHLLGKSHFMNPFSNKCSKRHVATLVTFILYL